jgi:hypothetical protein
MEASLVFDFFAGDGVEIDVGAGDGFEFLALVFLHHVHPEIIDMVAQQQHFDAFFGEAFELRAGTQGFDAFAGEVIDSILTIFHSRDIGVERCRCLVISGRRIKTAHFKYGFAGSRRFA